MRRHLRRVRDFLTPVRDEDLPQLDRTCQAALRILNPLLWASSIAFLAMQAATADLTLWAIAFPALCTAIYPVIGLAHQRRWASSEKLLFLTGLWLVVSMSYESLTEMSDYSDLLVYAGVTPMLFSAFIPWRARHSLFLVLPALATVTAMMALGRPLPMSGPVMISAWVGASVAAALSNQFHRRLLLALEKAKVRLAASERMSSLGRITASMAHELKTPLGASMTEAEMLRRLIEELGESIGHPEVEDDDLREIAAEMAASLSTMDQALKRSGRYVAAMREHTVGGQQRPNARFSIASRASSVLTLLRPVARKAGVVLTGKLDPDLELRGDPGKLDQVLMNLLQNAIDAVGAARGGHVELAARREGNEAVVRVADDGPGIPEALRELVFEPLFTTRIDSDGTGLGLSIARDAIQADFDGSLRLLSTPCGATFEIRCPLRSAPHSRREPTEPWVPFPDCGSSGEASSAVPDAA